MGLSLIIGHRAVLLWLFGLWIVVKSQVVEVDESFEEKRQNFAWLLEFYAPWCGHCKRLEPTYHQVYLGLRGSPIIVAKVDATKYPGLASAYDVRGYPSIKFIQGNKVISYNGDRTKEDIIEFAEKAFGPSVQLIKSANNFFNIQGRLSHSVFFTYVSLDIENCETDSNFATYKQVAEKFIVSSSFYLLEEHSLPEGTSLSRLPTTLVWKDDQYFEFRGETEELENWIKVERFSIFPAVGGIGLNEMSSLGKMLVIYVHSHPSNEWYVTIKNVALNNRNLLHRYQFLWLKDVEIGNNIVMSSVDTPFVFLLNSSDHHFYIYPFESLSEESFKIFLGDVESGKFKGHGGRGWTEKVKRLLYDISTTIHNIYKESIWLSLLVFGVPLLVISLIFYTLCCIEPIDDTIYEDSIEDDSLSFRGGLPEELKKVQ